MLPGKNQGFKKAKTEEEKTTFTNEEVPPPKRGRGRPRKYPRPEGLVEPLAKQGSSKKESVSSKNLDPLT